jgi:hypothetical protein
MKKNTPFELLILAIIMLPFAYVYFNWQPKLSLIHQNKLYFYIIAVLFFYFFPLLMQFLDSRKPNAELLMKSAKRIRLIWSAYLSALGFILFYFLLNDFEYEKPRLLGVALSLFLFASGNFRQNIHPSSIFAGNGIFSSKSSLLPSEERNNRKNQRFMAKLFFWVGIVGTVFFLYFKESTLTSWGLIFVGMVIFYGIAIRLIRSVV